MFKQHQIKRWLAAMAVVATAGFPSVAMAMPIEGASPNVPATAPVGGSRALQTPPELTDVSSGGYFTVPVRVSHSSQAPPELTDVSSGGYFTVSAVPATAQPDSGFQWGDAGIGAASIVVLMGAGAAASSSIRRHRVRRLVTG